MAATADRPTRVPSDLFDSAVVEGAKENRSAKQQLEHWTRVGRSVCARQTASRHRVEAALAGTLPVEQLSDEEGVVSGAHLVGEAQRVGAADPLRFPRRGRHPPVERLRVANGDGGSRLGPPVYRTILLLSCHLAPFTDLSPRPHT